MSSPDTAEYWRTRRMTDDPGLVLVEEPLVAAGTSEGARRAWESRKRAEPKAATPKTPPPPPPLDDWPEPLHLTYKEAEAAETWMLRDHATADDLARQADRHYITAADITRHENEWGQPIYTSSIEGARFGPGRDHLEVILTDNTKALTREAIIEAMNGVALGHLYRPLPAFAGDAVGTNTVRIIAEPKHPRGGYTQRVMAEVHPSDASQHQYNILLYPFAFGRSDKDWHPTGVRGLTNMAMTTLHEYGHLADFAPDTPKGRSLFFTGTYRAVAPPKEARTVSYYAKTNQDEFVAESFADWVGSAGTTTNPAVIELARKRHWAAPVLDAIAATAKEPT